MSGLMGLGCGMLLGKWLPRHPEVAARPRLGAVDGYQRAGLGRRRPRDRVLVFSSEGAV
jgi:hypothetical protein